MCLGRHSILTSSFTFVKSFLDCSNVILFFRPNIWSSSHWFSIRQCLFVRRLYQSRIVPLLEAFLFNVFSSLRLFSVALWLLEDEAFISETEECSPSHFISPGANLTSCYWQVSNCSSFACDISLKSYST